jgi:hypothetical protein
MQLIYIIAVYRIFVLVVQLIALRNGEQMGSSNNIRKFLINLIVHILVTTFVTYRYFTSGFLKG